MITIFQFIALCGAAVGFTIGGVIGVKFFGNFGGLVGAALGAYLGLIVGRLPGFFGKRALLNNIQCKTTEELRTILLGDQFQFFHLAIATLAARGEDIQKERDCVLKLLTSDNFAARVCGWRILLLFFPEVAKQIADYQPKDSVEVCRTKMHGLKGAGLT